MESAPGDSHWIVRDSRWDDLARNTPGESAQTRAKELRAQHPFLVTAAKAVGIRTTAGSFAMGAKGEREVGRKLNRWAEQNGWHVLHAVPVGWAGADIDHVVIASLSSPGGTPVFESVVALSPADVYAAGTNGTGPVLDHFNGTSWQLVALPSSFFSYGLNAITAKSDSDIWVFSNTGSPGVPLLLGNFNGSTWTTSPSPLPSNTLVAIGSAASNPSHVWLFGTNYNAGNQPLILSHS